MKKRTTFLIIPMLIALISSICFTACDYQVAQLDENKTENENPIVNPEVKTGTITGKALYTNADDNSGIIISLEKTAGNISASVAYCAYNVGSRSISGSTTTSSDGSYKFENVEEGTYTVYASSDKSSEKAVFTNISVQADTTTTVSDLKLTATGTISGIITLNESATGNEAFLVFIAGTSYMAMTDSAGKYTISGVPAGTNYQLLVTKGKLTKTIASNVTITANGNTTIPDLNFTDEDVNGKEEKTTSELQSYYRDPELNISYTTDYTDYDITEAVSDDINRPTQLGKGTYNISVKVVYCISAYSKEIYHSEKDELPLSEILKYDPNFKISTTSDLISFSEDYSEMTVKAAINDEQLTDVIKLKVLLDGEETLYYLRANSYEGMGGVDYGDHADDWSIMVSNETQQNLVLFYGAPSSNKIIGGVKAGAKNQHMAKSSAVFGNTSSDFIMYAVKEKDYLDNKDKLDVLDDAAFTTLYAYYNVDGDNGTVYTISSVLGGNCYIVVNNDSPYNVELRLDGVNGQSFAYCGKGMYNQKFYWDEGDYLVFPVFRKFSKLYGEIISIAPSKSNGKPVYETFSLVDKDGYRQYEFQASNWKTGQDFSFVPIAAYLKVVNLSSKGIALYPGANVTSVSVAADGSATTSTGAKYISTNAESNFLLYTFNLKQIGGSKTEPMFENRVILSNGMVGNAVERVRILNGDSLEIAAGHMLTLNVYDDDDGFRTALATKAGTDEILDYEVNFDEIDDVSVR